MPLRNTSAFSAVFEHAGEELRDEFAARFKPVCVAAFTKPVQRMPIDTGTAQASMRIGIGEADTSTEPRQRYSAPYQIAIQQLQKLSVLDSNPFQRVVVSLNVPYARPLEYGHSKQAPSGMFRVSLAELQSEFGGQ